LLKRLPPGASQHRIDGHGMVYCATEEIFDHSNPQHVQSAGRIQRALEKKGVWPQSFFSD